MPNYLTSEELKSWKDETALSLSRLFFFNSVSLPNSIYLKNWVDGVKILQQFYNILQHFINKSRIQCDVLCKLNLVLFHVEFKRVVSDQSKEFMQIYKLVCN